MLAAQVREQLARERNQLRAEFLAGGHAPRLLTRHSQLVDQILKEAWRSLDFPAGAALLAVGGYGRKRLFPYSDIDLLILLDEPADDAMRARIEMLIGLFWDIGLESGHSVRTLDECVAEAEKDVTVRTNLLEARLLAGRKSSFRLFEQTMRDALECQSFCNAKQLEQQQRHLRFHGTSHNLEPNLKESPGGLRDLQTLIWISRACGFGSSWHELAKHGLITRNEAARIGRDQNFLELLRIKLHYLAGRREDRLLFDYQAVLAAGFGIQDKGARRASEELMQRYYRTAKSVSQLNTILLQNLRARIFPAPERGLTKLGYRFQIRGDLLEAQSETLFETCPSAILECFLLLQRHPELKGMSAETLRALWRATARIKPAFRRDEQNRQLFMAILREPKGITQSLRRMNEYGVLGKYIPAFGRIVGQMQHDLFHVYTVDEHILKVVRNLRRFAMTEYAHEYPLCSRLFTEFERPEVLYLAGLFHDIAKGRGGDHSSLGRRDALRFCKQHRMSIEDSELVASLVENHLAMSATAQKMDLSDPDVIAAFAARVKNERHLIGLYLLTVADIRGTSPQVWNAWKEKLLEDLFRATQRYLSGDQPSKVSSLQSRKNEAFRLLRLYAIPDQGFERLWSQLDMVYFLQHDPNEIAWHSRMLYNRLDGVEPIVKARMSLVGEGLQVMIYAREREDLFAQITGFFERIGYSIAEAKIHTTKNGYSLDSFLVLDPARKVEHYRDLIAYIEHELKARLSKQLPLEPLLQSRLSRHLKHFPIQPQVSILPDDKGIYRILSIIAGDRPGLLSRISRTLAAYHVNVNSAKINTLGERAEDTFLISGEALNDAKKLINIESDLLHQLET